MSKGAPFWKSAVGWIFFILGALLYVIQQSFAVFSFPQALDRYTFLILVFGLMSAGITSIIGGNGTWTWIKDFVISLLVMFGVFLLFNSIGLVYDASMGSNYYSGSYVTLLDAATSPISEYSAIANTVLSCVPVAIVIIGVVFVLIGDGPDEYMTVILEVVIAILLLIGSAYLFNLTLGFNIFRPF